MTKATTRTKGPTKAELQAKHDFWAGQVRYYKTDEGIKRIFPEWVGTAYWCPEGLVRETCKGVDMEGMPIWVITPDAPAPAGDFANNNATHSRATENPASPSPPYDYRPPAYASDTQSGGPANFHGNAGGLDNPRNPESEGEVPGELDDKLQQFKAQLDANAANAGQ